MNRLHAAEISLLFAGVAAILSFALSFVSTFFAVHFKVLDIPCKARKIHQGAIPLLGGLGIAFSVFIVVSIGSLLHVFAPSISLWGYLVGCLLLLIGGILDDRYDLPSWVQILFPILAAFCVIMSKIGIVQITNPIGHGGFSLVWWKLGGLSLPSDLITFVWIIVATYATKILDGLDGLVTGLTAIGAGLVGALTLSVSFFQPSVAYFASIVCGSFLGFLPRNMFPAKQFLGESGATIAGFSLAVLAVLSSAKIAIALTVLAIPIADIVFVIIGRLRRGAKWYEGDDTHLHHRLLKAGLSHRASVFLVWGVSLCAGILALSFQTRGKLFVITSLVALAALTSYFAGLRARKIS